MEAVAAQQNQPTRVRCISCSGSSMAKASVTNTSSSTMTRLGPPAVLAAITSAASQACPWLARLVMVLVNNQVATAVLLAAGADNCAAAVMLKDTPARARHLLIVLLLSLCMYCCCWWRILSSTSSEREQALQTWSGENSNINSSMSQQSDGAVGCVKRKVMRQLTGELVCYITYFTTLKPSQTQR